MSGWKMFGFGLVAVIAMSVAWLYIRPYFHTYPEQDECSFGPVSNERYRELLAEAKRRQASGEWSRLSPYGGDSTNKLQARLNELMLGLGSIHERIAAMHAVMRAAGAELRRPSDAKSFYDRNGLPVGIQGYLYTLDVHKIFGFDPFRRYGWLSIQFHTHTTIHKTLIDTFQASVQWPIPIFAPWSHPFDSHPPHCPAVPDEEWVELYEASRSRFGH